MYHFLLSYSPQQSHFSVGRAECLRIRDGGYLSLERFELQAQLPLLLPLLDVVRLHVGQDGLLHQFLGQQCLPSVKEVGAQWMSYLVRPISLFCYVLLWLLKAVRTVELAS